MRRALLLPLLLGALATAAFRAEDTYTLFHKHTLDEVQRVVMTMEAKYDDLLFKSEVTMTQKVTKVETDGAYTVEMTMTDQRTSINGEEVPADGEAPEPLTISYDAKGNEIKSGPEDDEENGPLDVAFDFEPDSPVKIGETWTPKKEDGEPENIAWTLIGREELDGKPVLVLDGRGKGPDDETIESKVWLDSETYIARRAVSKITGIKQEEGPEGEMTVTIEEKP